MTQVASVYAQALYSLAKEEGSSADILEQLKALNESFHTEPDYLRLLAAPNLPKDERCAILDEGFRGKVHPHVLNFMKILTGRGYMRYFSDCFKAYRAEYNRDNGILEVCAVTAVPLSGGQTARLTEKLGRITGKAVMLENRIDPACLGGMRLDYDGKRVDDTVAHRLESISLLLKNTVL